MHGQKQLNCEGSSVHTAPHVGGSNAAFVPLLLQVYSDFDSFFADKHNARAVYRPSASAYFMYYHAVTLVRSALQTLLRSCFLAYLLD
jgi:hypothetical protein